MTEDSVGAIDQDLSRGLYRVGVVVMLAGLGTMMFRLHNVEVPPEGWYMFVGGLLIAVHGAVEPIATTAIKYYEDWASTEVEIDAN